MSQLLINDYLKQLDIIRRVSGSQRGGWVYKLGNRSAIDWVLDQYKEKKPKDPTI